MKIMTKEDRSLVQRLWNTVLVDEFHANSLIQGCIDDAGYDFHGAGLTVQMLRDIWNGVSSKADWHSVGFFAGELLAFYQALGESFESKHLPRWAFAMLLVRNAIARGYSSWDLQRDKALVVFWRVEGSLRPEDRELLQNIIGRPNPPCVSRSGNID